MKASEQQPYGMDIMGTKVGGQPAVKHFGDQLHVIHEAQMTLQCHTNLL